MKIKQTYELEIDTDYGENNKSEIYYASKVFDLAAKSLAAEDAGGHVVSGVNEQYSVPHATLTRTLIHIVSINDRLEDMAIEQIKKDLPTTTQKETTK